MSVAACSSRLSSLADFLICGILFVGCSNSPASVPKEPHPETQQASEESQPQQESAGVRTELQKVATSFANFLEQYRGVAEGVLTDGQPQGEWDKTANDVLIQLSQAERLFVTSVKQTLRSEKITLGEFIGDAIADGPAERELEICIAAQGQWSANMHSMLGDQVDQLRGLQNKMARLEEFIKSYETKDEDFMRSYEAHARKTLTESRQDDGDQIDAEAMKHWTRSMLEAEIPVARANLQRRQAQLDEHAERFETTLDRISGLADVVRRLTQ